MDNKQKLEVHSVYNIMKYWKNKYWKKFRLFSVLIVMYNVWKIRNVPSRAFPSHQIEISPISVTSYPSTSITVILNLLFNYTYHLESSKRHKTAKSASNFTKTSQNFIARRLTLSATL